MSVYTSVSDDEMRALLTRYPLGGFRSLQGIAQGITNSNFFLHTDSGSYVLTVFETLRAEELPFFMDLTRHLSQNGVACPAPVAQNDGMLTATLAGKPACIVEKLSGSDTASPTPAECRSTGAMLAKMHLAGQTFPQRMDNPRFATWWTDSAAKLLPLMDEADAGLLRDEIRYLAEHPDTALPSGVIHADLFKDNVLLDSDQVAGFIDFYYACHGSFVYDAAIAVNDWARRADHSIDPVLRDAFLEGYQSVRPLTEAERAYFPTACRAGCVRFWVSRLLDFHFPAEGEMTFIKDPNVFRDLLLAYRDPKPARLPENSGADGGQNQPEHPVRPVADSGSPNAAAVAKPKSGSTKNLMFFIGLCALLFCSFWGWIISLLGIYRYGEFFFAAVIAAYIWTWVDANRPAPRKIHRPALLVLAASIAYGSYIGITEYRRSIPQVSDEMQQWYYDPARETNQLARLNRPAALQLVPPLPVMDGSTALYPLYAAFAQAVYPKMDYSLSHEVVRVSKTGAAYDALLAGKVDVIFVPAPSKDHRAKAEAKGLKYTLTPVGKEAFMFFVNKNNPVENLSIEQIKQIYSGRIRNWRDVGGSSDSIRAFQRPENSGSQTMLQKIMEGTPLPPAPREDVAEGMGGIINRVTDYRNYDNAIGFSFLFFSTEMVKNNQIKLLSINGITPNHDNIRNGRYPFTAEIYAVTTGRENEATRRLIAWVQSPEGQTLVQRTGYVPIAPTLPENGTGKQP